MNILIYTCSYLCILIIVILERRLPRIHKHLSWIRRKNDRFFTYSLFEDEDAKQFQTHETLQIPFLIVTLLATVLTISVYPHGNAREIARFRLGQLILINLILLCLLSSRHSVFLELAAAHQAEYLWAHKILGTLTLAGSTVFAGLGFQGRGGSRSFALTLALTTNRVPYGLARRFGRHIFCHTMMNKN